jgi:CheY-like chemotaxis protein
MPNDALCERYVAQFAKLNVVVKPYDLVGVNEADLDARLPVWLDMDEIQRIYEQPLSLINDFKTQHECVTLLVSHKQASEWREQMQVLDVKMRIKPIKYANISHWINSCGSPKESVTTFLTQDMALSANQTAKILLVEDNLVNQKLALALLKKMGLSATVAQNGQEALEFLAQQPFDVVLMDCQMPIKDGYQATKELRASNLANKNIPVMAMTANAMQGDEEKCYASGMSDYLTKPVNPNIMAQKLTKWLS